jgi:hypothetical protein
VSSDLLILSPKADLRPAAAIQLPTVPSTSHSFDSSQPYLQQHATSQPNPLGRHMANSYTPVQVFLPPMYTTPVGAVSLPDTTDEGLLHYFMTVASKTWSALDSFGLSSRSDPSKDADEQDHPLP